MRSLSMGKYGLSYEHATISATRALEWQSKASAANPGRFAHQWGHGSKAERHKQLLISFGISDGVCNNNEIVRDIARTRLEHGWSTT
jgi:hypothetical protein